MNKIFLKSTLLLSVFSLCSCNVNIKVKFDRKYENILNEIKDTYNIDEPIEIITPSLFAGEIAFELKANEKVIEPIKSGKYMKYILPNLGTTINLRFELDGSNEFKILKDVLNTDFDFSSIVEVAITSFGTTQPNWIDTWYVSNNESDIKLALSKLYAPVSKEHYQPFYGSYTKKYLFKNNKGEEFIIPKYHINYINDDEGYVLFTNFESFDTNSSQYLGFHNTYNVGCGFIDINTNHKIGELKLDTIKFTKLMQGDFENPKLKADQPITGFGDLYVFKENIFGILDENNVYTYYQTIGTPFASLLQNL